LWFTLLLFAPGGLLMRLSFSIDTRKVADGMLAAAVFCWLIAFINFWRNFRE